MSRVGLSVKALEGDREYDCVAVLDERNVWDKDRVVNERLSELLPGSTYDYLTRPDSEGPSCAEIYFSPTRGGMDFRIEVDNSDTAFLGSMSTENHLYGYLNRGL